jgi:hypothetical protein
MNKNVFTGVNNDKQEEKDNQRPRHNNYNDNQKEKHTSYHKNKTPYNKYEETNNQEHDTNETFDHNQIKYAKNSEKPSFYKGREFNKEDGEVHTKKFNNQNYERDYEKQPYIKNRNFNKTEDEPIPDKLDRNFNKKNRNFNVPDKDDSDTRFKNSEKYEHNRNKYVAKEETESQGVNRNYSKNIDNPNSFNNKYPSKLENAEGNENKNYYKNPKYNQNKDFNNTDSSKTKSNFQGKNDSKYNPRPNYKNNNYKHKYSKNKIYDNYQPSLPGILKLLGEKNISINLNINNTINNQNSITNNNSIVNNNNIQEPKNKEELDQLKNQIIDLTNKLETLQILQTQTIEEHENLQKEIAEKMNQQNFKMDDIQKEVIKLSKMESAIEENKKKIESLEESKELFDDVLEKHSEKLQELEDSLENSVKELEKQYQFLDANYNDNFADKFNQVEKELNKMKLELAIKSQNDIDFSIPSTWTKQNENLVLIELPSNSNEFINLNDSFMKTMLGHTIIKIYRIQNLDLWKNFCFAKHQLEKKGTFKSLQLFHGTKTTDPKEIYSGKEEGFDMRFSNEGLWGRGIYFHQRARYSHDYRFRNIHVSLMLSADVLVGEYVELYQDSCLRFPPFKDQTKKIRYDSVKSNSDGIHIVYNNMRAYPSYLIEYS